MILILQLSCLALTISGSVLKDSRIIDGIETTIQEYPYHVALFSGKHFKCGGSILSDEWVLTAAHCKSANSIHAGVTNQATSTKTSDVLQFIPHPKYVSSNTTVIWGYDIALYKLKQKLPLDGVTMKAVKLADVAPEEGHMCTVTGWGDTSTVSNYGSDILLKADLPVASFSYCKVQMETIEPDYVHEGDFCLGGGNYSRNACHGDSGSAAVNQNGAQVGVVSRGNPSCQHKDYPVIFTNVNYKEHRDFIKEHTGL